jgi:hypothetical protein
MANAWLFVGIAVALRGHMEANLRPSRATMKLSLPALIVGF